MASGCNYSKWIQQTKNKIYTEVDGWKKENKPLNLNNYKKTTKQTYIKIDKSLEPPKTVIPGQASILMLWIIDMVLI